MTPRDKSHGSEAPGKPGTPEPAGSTLESFVAQLHNEGVEAGRREAERLADDARAEAEEIVRGARAEADAILAEARSRAAETETRGRASLELAIRDAILQLQAALTQVLGVILAGGVRSELADPDLLKALLETVLASYARADAVGRPTELRVPRDLATAFTAWWRQEMASALAADPPRPELKAVLDDAGFEYRLSTGGTVEVSVESTVEKLMELVRPGLHDLVAAAGAAALRQPPAEALDLAAAGTRGR